MVKSVAEIRRVAAELIFIATVFATFLVVQAHAILAEPDSSGQSATAVASEAAGARRSAVASRAEREIGIDAGDLLEINVFEVPELSRDYRVHSGGQIDVPLFREPVQAEGLSPDQLAAALADDLRTDGLVSHPRVTVEIKESLARSVTVAGAVKKPQMIPVFGRTTLLDAISLAGGVAENAGSVATITRGKSALLALEVSGPPGWMTSGAAPVVTVNLRRLMETGDPDLNPELFPGDRVLVEQAGVVYVVGAVNRAGGFLLTGDKGPMTLLKALALAEGLKSTAVANKALILRQSGGSHMQVPAHLKNVLAGHAPDQLLYANDILFVPDSNSQKAIRRGAEAAVEIATGIMIWRL
ncbi:MAG: polysaccharide biosynthesis/export family protein [Terriglobia bacterium]